MNKIHDAVVIVARMVTKQMSTDELVAVNLAAQFGLDPRNAMGYDKAKPLFTENNATLMHHDTRVVLAAIVAERLAQEEGQTA